MKRIIWILSLLLLVGTWQIVLGVCNNPPIPDPCKYVGTDCLEHDLCTAGQNCCVGTLFAKCYDTASEGCCNGVIYNKTQKCCSPTGTLVGKGPPISNLADCPARVQDHAPVPDGCSPFPSLEDEPPVPGCGPVLFQGCCIAHDICYQTCHGVDDPVQRSNCDDAFSTCLINKCNSYFGAGTTCGNICGNIAIIYADVVHGSAGLTAYNDDQKNYCKCCAP